MITLTEPQAWTVGTACVLLLMDIVTGGAQAFANHTFSSSKMREGLMHKAMELVIIALAFVLEIAGTHIVGLPFSGVTVVAVGIYVIVMEVGSILENVAKVNPELRDSPLLKLFANKDEGSEE